MTAGERAQPVEMRLDMAEQRIGEMNPQQIGQRRIGPVEIHAGGIGREQSRLVGCRIDFAWLLHLQLLFVPPRIAILSDHRQIKQATKPSRNEKSEDHPWLTAIWLTAIASSAPRCRPTRSRYAPIFATKPSRINGFCEMPAARRNTRNTPKCRSSLWWLRPRAPAFKTPHRSSTRWKSFIRSRRSTPMSRSRASFRH